jgi:hypothetical protein
MTATELRALQVLPVGVASDARAIITLAFSTI